MLGGVERERGAGEERAECVGEEEKVGGVNVWEGVGEDVENP